jgi:hypothetical protein
MVLATVPEAPPTIRNQRATSCPAPISAKEPTEGGWIEVQDERFVVGIQSFMGKHSRAPNSLPLT